MGANGRSNGKISIDVHREDSRTASREEITAQVERLLGSSLFQHSDSNRQLLVYLGKRAVTHPGEPVKEIELATSVFGLSLETFDPQVDSTIRVKMGRLRNKILDYYSSEGTLDGVVLEIPKGAYCLIPHVRAQQPAAPSVLLETPALAPRQNSSTESPQTTVENRTWRHWTAAAGILLAGALLGGACMFLWVRHSERVLSPSLAQFWNGFYDGKEPLTVVFSNPRLAGRLWQEGLHYFREGDDSVANEPINLGYAGAGDVPSVFVLTHLFDRLHWNFHLASGALLSWDEAKGSNLIFLGRPEQNPALHQIPRLNEFYFRYGMGIVNAHPQPGEAMSYPYNFAYDYAVIAFTPGILPGTSTLVLAGDTTFGSQAAVECLTNEACVAELLNKLQVKRNRRIPYFEALLKVKINNQVPVWHSIIAVHPYRSDSSSWQAPTDDER